MQPRKRCDFCDNQCLWKNVEDVDWCYRGCDKVFRCCEKCKGLGKHAFLEDLKQEHELDKHASIDLV